MVGPMGLQESVPDKGRGPRLTAMRELSPREYLQAPVVTGRRGFHCVLFSGVHRYPRSSSSKKSSGGRSHFTPGPSLFLGIWRRAFWTPQSRVWDSGLEYNSSGELEG